MIEALAGHPEWIATQAAINSEQMADMQQAIRARDAVIARERRTIQRLRGLIAARVEIVTWLLTDADELVFDIDTPCANGGTKRVALRLDSVFEDGDHATAAKLIGAVLAGDEFPRTRCACCQEAECRGCGGEVSEVRVPAKVATLLGGGGQ